MPASSNSQVNVRDMETGEKKTHIIIRFFLAARTLSIVTVATLLLGLPALLAALVDRTGRLPYRIGQAWARFILWTNGVRIRVEGLGSISRKVSYVFVSNHQSNLDGPAIGVSLPSPLRFVIKRSLLRIPIMGQAFKLGRMIAIDRSDGEKSIETINRAARELRGGISALFFGEGSRTRDGALRSFKKGASVFAIRAGLPLVPVTVMGGFRLLPPGALHIRGGVLRIVIGAAIPTKGLTPDDADRLTETARKVIEENLAGCI